MTAKKYASKVKDSFALPEVAVNIREILDSPQSDAEDIAALIALDPSLCSKLLKLANSSLFRFPSQISSISKAISIIGGEALYILVMSETAANAYQHFENDVVNLERFWKHSVMCGLMGQNLSKTLKVRGSERFFLMGLLNNFAELVVAKQNPELTKKCDSKLAEQFPWVSQKNILGFYYADCTAEILKSWNLPTQLHEPLINIHNAESAVTNKEVAVLYLSYRIALKVAYGRTFAQRNPIDGRVLDSLDLHYEDLESVSKQTQMEAKEMLHLLNPGLF